MEHSAFIGLGSNLGEKAANLEQAVEYIRKIPQTTIQKLSSVYLTEPWGKKDQADFLNQVLKLETALDPYALLHGLQDIEIKMGRLRVGKWGPRIIDLDILAYGNETIIARELIIPHPHMRGRVFVLVPLQEIEPEYVFPNGDTIGEVLGKALAQEEQLLKKII